MDAVVSDHFVTSAREALGWQQGREYNAVMMIWFRPKTTPDYQTQCTANMPYEMTLSKYFANNVEPFPVAPAAAHCVLTSSAALNIGLLLTKHGYAHLRNITSTVYNTLSLNI